MFLCGVLGAVLIVSVSLLTAYFWKSKQQAHLYSNLAAVRAQDVQQKIASQSSVQPASRNLYLENSDMVGWIQIEGTCIDYPVMQTPTDPTYYLKHDFEKNYTDYGCPFMQADCDAIAPSDNLIIYGHNMKDGSMFADLAKYGAFECGVLCRHAGRIAAGNRCTAIGSFQFQLPLYRDALSAGKLL